MDTHETEIDAERSRREFLKQLALVTGGVVLMPAVSGCPAPKQQAATGQAGGGGGAGEGEKKAMPEVPGTKPADWNPIAFNRERGLAGAIPESYWPSIQGPDGEKKHLGKHLPFVPTLDASLVPAGFMALMWGDPSKGYAKHPNAVRNASNNNEGHWYNWIRVAKVGADGAHDELQSSYSEWPGIKDGDNGSYAVFGGGEITADDGKNTVYLCALPKDTKKGDAVRIWAHCLTHGEYVDFITVA